MLENKPQFDQLSNKAIFHISKGSVDNINLEGHSKLPSEGITTSFMKESLYWQTEKLKNMFSKWQGFKISENLSYLEAVRVIWRLKQ